MSTEGFENEYQSINRAARFNAQRSQPAYDSTESALAVLSLLDYLQDLFTVGKQAYTREEVLVILNLVREDPELIDPLAVVAYQMATEGIGE